MSGPIFESVYREKLWRIQLCDYGGQRRLSVWSHYRERQTGDWRPCGGKRESPGFFVEAENVDELAATLAAIAAELQAQAAT